MKKNALIFLVFYFIMVNSKAQSLIKIYDSGISYIFALDKDSALWCWGYDQPPGKTGTDLISPVKVNNNDKWLDIPKVYNFKYRFGIKKDGTLWKWEASSTTPPNLWDRNSKWKAIASGSGQVIGIKEDGTLWSWGDDNANGAQGNGTTIAYSTPFQISNETNWIKVFAGEYYSMALKSDGTLWSWGSTGYGQLGLGFTGTINVLSPTQIQGDDWEHVVCGRATTYALKKDSTLWIWGSGEYGQMGNGETQIINRSPVQLGTANDWTAIAAGDFHFIGMRGGRDVYSWGANRYGEMGNGNADVVKFPILITTSAKAISAGYCKSFYINEDGSFCSAGENQTGTLGLGYNSIGFTTSFGCSTPVITSVIEMNESLNTKVYPNPFNEYCTIEPSKHFKKYNFELFDEAGTRIQQITNLEGWVTFKKDKLKPGVYFYVLKEMNTMEMVRGKLFIQ